MSPRLPRSAPPILFQMKNVRYELIASSQISPSPRRRPKPDEQVHPVLNWRLVPLLCEPGLPGSLSFTRPSKAPALSWHLSLLLFMPPRPHTTGEVTPMYSLPLYTEGGGLGWGFLSAANLRPLTRRRPFEL